jgi:hypothetical protein
MYLQDFESAGTLTLDAAEKISWKTSEFDTKIVLVVNHRRVNVHCLSLCWDELDIHRGTPVSIAVGDGPARDDAEERRALIAMVDYFQSMTTPEPSVARRRRRFSFGGH